MPSHLPYTIIISYLHSNWNKLRGFTEEKAKDHEVTWKTRDCLLSQHCQSKIRRDSLMLTLKKKVEHHHFEMSLKGQK